MTESWRNGEIPTTIPETVMVVLKHFSKNDNEVQAFYEILGLSHYDDDGEFDLNVPLPAGWSAPGKRQMATHDKKFRLRDE